VLLDKPTSLDGGQLAEVGVLMASSNLDEEDKRLRLAVELFLQDAGGFLDVSLGGWMREARVSEGEFIFAGLDGMSFVVFSGTYDPGRSAIAAGIVADS
jgi:hypothetical protein